MTHLILLLLALVNPLQEEFSSFSFCRDGLQGADERWCIELNASGEGTFRSGSSDADLIEEPLALTENATETFRALLAGTAYLEDGDQYESDRRVADLGKKTLVVEGGWGSRQAVFNYSENKEVGTLASFMEKLIGQEILLIDIDVALEFDRLSIPGKLEELEKSLNSNRVADARRLIPTLDRIAQDPRLLNFARTRAAALKQEIENNY